MNYTTERYENLQRFNRQYPRIYEFLLRAEAQKFNEHFPWGRFEWMHIHTMLDETTLTEIVLFKDAAGEIVGLLTYDTCYDDRTYLIHTNCDEALLNLMVDTVLQHDGESAVIKVNSKDEALKAILQRRQFQMAHQEVSVLELDLSNTPEYDLPEGYTMNPQDAPMDLWQYQLVIHKGFDNEGIPKPWETEVLERGFKPGIRVFAIKDGSYCAHCGIWYSEGSTAYVEPVATVAEHRRKGLAKAAIYEACRRAKALGAKRATVLSDQEFYHRIGFNPSSAILRFERIR